MSRIFKRLGRGLEALREEFEWTYNPDSGSYERGPSISVYRFEWFLYCDCEASVTIVLPKKCELLPGYYNPQEDTYYPDRVSISMDRVSALFLKDNLEPGIFGFGVAFSKKGIEFIEEGEEKFNLGQYDEAKLAYQDAIKFYSTLPAVYGKDKDQLLDDLENRISEIEEIIQQKSDNKGDIDNDGVTDDLDECNDSICTIVDSRGCPKDSDSDGVSDCEDECPLEYGNKDKNGCPPQKGEEKVSQSIVSVLWSFFSTILSFLSQYKFPIGSAIYGADVAYNIKAYMEARKKGLCIPRMKVILLILGSFPLFIGLIQPKKI